MFKVAIDPGHFGGNLSILEDRHFSIGSGVPIKEGDLNLKVALKLKKLLEDEKISVLLTRESVNDKPENISDFEEFRLSNMEQRVLLINNFNPDFSVSIHFNSNCYSHDFFITEKNGIMTFIFNDEKTLVEKAKVIANNLSLDFELGFCKKSWFLSDVAKMWKDLGSGVNIRDLLILRGVKTPIVLTEGPLMNNMNVYKSLIAKDDLLNIYAKSLYTSIKEILHPTPCA